MLNEDLRQDHGLPDMVLLDDLSLTPTERKIISAIEVVRIIITATGIGFGYARDYRIFATLIVISLAGITAVESLAIGEITARSKNWPAHNPYQIQSAFNNLASTFTIILLLLMKANDESLAAVVVVVLSFILMNGCNHLYQVIK